MALFKRVQEKINYCKIYLSGLFASIVVVCFLGEYTLLYNKICVIKYIYSQMILSDYLIHENDYMSSILWDHVFKVVFFYSKAYFPILFICIAIIVYVV